MLYSFSMNSYWRFLIDREKKGVADGWQARMPEGTDAIWVPSCWNELKEDLFHYEGVAWYFKQFHFRSEPGAARHTLFFYGVNYSCDIWLNGVPVGAHTGGFTPFEIDVTGPLDLQGENFLAVRVDSKIGEMTSPPIGVDWFNYGGVFRDVCINSTGESWIDDVTVSMKVDGRVEIKLALGNFRSACRYEVDVKVEDPDELICVYHGDEHISTGEHSVCFTIANPRLWSPADSFQYDFRLTLKQDGHVMDAWSHKIGVREFSILGRQILLNGNPIQLRGYSKHEEYPMYGRTFSWDVVRRDYEMCKRGGANFLRLCHYPHHLREYELASEEGFLVIAEVPNVNFKKEQFENPELLDLAMRQMQETIKYLKNETCILFWSLFIECKTYEDAAVEFVPKYVALAKRLDPSRLTVHASDIPEQDRTYDFFDVVGVNYWRGWYGGESIEEGSALIDRIAASHPGKPVVMTSGGWEGIYGYHSYGAGMKWSEESQADYLEALTDMYLTKDYIAGQIVWTFNDFRVSPWLAGGNAIWTGRPMELNHKGVTDLYRRPKLAYYRLKEKFREWDSRPALPPEDPR